MRDVSKADVTQNDFASISRASNTLKDTAIHIDDSAQLDVIELEAFQLPE